MEQDKRDLFFLLNIWSHIFVFFFNESFYANLPDGYAPKLQILRMGEMEYENLLGQLKDILQDHFSSKNLQNLIIGFVSIHEFRLAQVLL